NLGIKVINLPAANDLSQAYKEILRLGRLTGHTTAAQATVLSMRTHLAAIVRTVPRSRRHLRVYHELEQTYYPPTSDTFIGRINELFGLRDNADGTDTTTNHYPQHSSDNIIQQNPQISVLADTKCCQQTATTVAARPGWSTIAAVRHHRVTGVDDDVA